MCVYCTRNRTTYSNGMPTIEFSLVFVVVRKLQHKKNTGDQSSMDCKRTGIPCTVYVSHTGVSRMGTARVKWEEETDKNNNRRGVRNVEERNVGTKGKVPNKAYITTAKAPNNTRLEFRSRTRPNGRYGPKQGVINPKTLKQDLTSPKVPNKA